MPFDPPLADPSPSRPPKIVVFDIGNVLLRWNPRHLYRQLFDDADKMEWFLREVCTADWNLEQDRGRSWPDAVAERVALFPDWADHIRAYDERWHETLAGPIEESVALLASLKAAGLPVYAITNFSAEKFAEVSARFPFMAWFDGIVVSAHERLVKPDPALFALFLDRFGLSAGDCVFIDDSAANVRAAEALGMAAVHFREGMDLAAAVAALGVALPVQTSISSPS